MNGVVENVEHVFNFVFCNGKGGHQNQGVGQWAKEQTVFLCKFTNLMTDAVFKRIRRFVLAIGHEFDGYDKTALANVADMFQILKTTCPVEQQRMSG